MTAQSRETDRIQTAVVTRQLRPSGKLGKAETPRSPSSKPTTMKMSSRRCSIYFLSLAIKKLLKPRLNEAINIKVPSLALKVKIRLLHIGSKGSLPTLMTKVLN